MSSHFLQTLALVASFSVLIGALPQREPSQERVSESDHFGSRYYNGGGKIRNLDQLGGGNTVRDLHRQAGPGYAFAKSYPYEELAYNKRNFDEIDRSGFDSFVKKRNFDEIDRTSFGTFNKRNAQSGFAPYAYRYYDLDN